MRRTTWSIATALVTLCVLSAIPSVLGECPNGCSGNGDCMSKDMCNCHKNFQGNDCADRTCLFGRAHVDTPKGDIDMDMDRLSPGWILENSQQDPAKTYEYFNPDAIASEAHFYMECSNKGICDRTTGLCQCFDGYEGNGCQRTTCPGKCNGHGTCESIRELAAKNGGTLFGLEGAAGAVTYDLWDANSTYGCRCDPWFFGPDCNKRSCKVGVDPLYLSPGSPRYETFVIHAYAATAAELTDAWIRLRVFDYHGESYITKKIPILNDAHATPATALANNEKNAAAVADAIMSVPNLTFRKITCEPTGVGSDLAHFLSDRPASMFGLVVTCQYTENPGKVRIPEIESKAGVTSGSVVTTSVQGDDDDWFTLKSEFIVDTIAADAVTLTATSPDPTALDEKLIKIGPHVVKVKAITGTAGTWGLTLEYALEHSIVSNVPIYTTDPLAAVSLSAVTALSAALTVGSDLMTFAAAPEDTQAVPEAIKPGDLLFIENAFFNVQELTNDGLATPVAYYARLNKPFGGAALDGADVATAAIPFKVIQDGLKPYQYVSECSGRGMCNYESGVCTCFKGYTNDNCDTQNILAL